MMGERAQMIATVDAAVVILNRKTRPALIKKLIFQVVATVEWWIQIDHLAHKGVMQRPLPRCEKMHRILIVQIDHEFYRLLPALTTAVDARSIFPTGMTSATVVPDAGLGAGAPRPVPTARPGLAQVEASRKGTSAPQAPRLPPG